jgi:hypothetical protein
MSTLVYVAAQYLLLTFIGRMYFSSTFFPEVILYIFLGIFYILIVSNRHKNVQLRHLILGVVVGAIIFVALALLLFFQFEFGTNLSV